MKKITIRDVAKAAGVSTATVSNALNDAEVINKETKERVLRIARELNYVPNMSGRMLKVGKSNMIGFISSSFTGPYFSELIETMQRECEERGYGLMFIYTQRPQIIRNYVFGGGLDGIFLFEGVERFGTEDVKQMESQKIKGIFLDRDIEGANIGSITFNSHASAYRLTEEMIRQGHQNIMFISGPYDVQDSVYRMEGFREAMKAHGLPCGDEQIVPGFFTEQVTYEAVHQMAREGRAMPDAFIAGNDSSAMGCIRALRELGYEVPKDVSVAGFDDIELARYFEPALTTVRMPISEQGRMAVHMLLDMIAGQSIEEMSVKLDGEVVIRNSTRSRN